MQHLKVLCHKVKLNTQTPLRQSRWHNYKGQQKTWRRKKRKRNRGQMLVYPCSMSLCPPHVRADDTTIHCRWKHEACKEPRQINQLSRKPVCFFRQKKEWELAAEIGNPAQCSPWYEGMGEKLRTKFYKCLNIKGKEWKRFSSEFVVCTLPDQSQPFSGVHIWFLSTSCAVPGTRTASSDPATYSSDHLIQNVITWLRGLWNKVN